MLIKLEELVEKYALNINKILHVGAHECEEMQSYRSYVNDHDIVWVEAIGNKADFCKRKYPDTTVVNAVVSDNVEEVKFNVSNNVQSSSILEFGLHEQYHPTVKYVNHFHATTVRLDTILDALNFRPNFLNLDIQGVELRAMKGMGNYLEHVDYIYTEVNDADVYIGCDRITDIDVYLAGFDFHRVETRWCGDFKWGDAFYIKNKT
jgi:FkbM family methyltransferase